MKKDFLKRILGRCLDLYLLASRMLRYFKDCRKQY